MVAAALVVGVLGAVAVLALGPEELVVCDQADGLARWFRGSHIDGPDASRCPVPAPSTQIIAVLALLLPAAALGWRLAARRRT